MAARDKMEYWMSWHRLRFVTQLDAAVVIRYRLLSKLSLRVIGGACS